VLCGVGVPVLRPPRHRKQRAVADRLARRVYRDC
jgi:hypothetical protein